MGYGKGERDGEGQGQRQGRKARKKTFFITEYLRNIRAIPDMSTDWEKNSLVSAQDWAD